MCWIVIERMVAFEQNLYFISEKTLQKILNSGGKKCQWKYFSSSLNVDYEIQTLYVG